MSLINNKRVLISTDSSPSPIKKTRVNPTSTSTLPGPPFTRDHFINSLSISQRDLLALESASIGLSWLQLLQHELTLPYFIQLKSFLHAESIKNLSIFPPPNQIYSWSRFTPLTNVRVVILGQDPYHDDGQAMGLSFSVPPTLKKLPRSLKNIFKELKSEYPHFVPPSHGNLASWALSGVLLLNSSLTVQAHKAASHAGKGWETFTDKLVDLVDQFGGSGEVGKQSQGVVFLAWGAHAAKRVAKLDKNKHLILTSPHPSPLSARRGFFGNGHFKAANTWLQEKYGDEATIDWTKLEADLTA